MKVKDGVARLVKEFKNDPEFRQAWEANIAMAYKDNYRWHTEKTGKKQINANDRHIIANKAAKYFLDQLCKE